MLLGEYEHTLDVKGRLAMPSKLRESLGNKFIITKGLDGCLFVYDLEQWHILETKLTALPMSRKNARDFARFFFSGACEGECDKQAKGYTSRKYEVDDRLHSPCCRHLPALFYCVIFLLLA